MMKIRKGKVFNDSALLFNVYPNNSSIHHQLSLSKLLYYSIFFYTISASIVSGDAPISMMADSFPPVAFNECPQ